jgi:CNT family concentrative nucleoside transporter
MQQLQSVLGIVAILGFAWAISENRRAVSWKQAAIGLAVTFATALLLLKVPGVKTAFAGINDAVGAIAAARGPAPRSSSAISAAAPCPTT